MPSVKAREKLSITPVQIVLKRTFLCVKDGYIVNKDAGFGIVNGRGEVGSLVIHNGTAAGVVSHIGRDD